ncbi:hypothetical protein [Myxococcus hansupus]|uniref:hypothetical protein n=1 Tax=Pseudomyxococcus hansupus TaxID=1297742 RepID=UPI0011874E87|nr:hypothetical protein [Myxococcus hansupus]
MQRITERITCENPGLTPIELWLEPSGMCFSIPASGRLEITCEGPLGGRIEIERHPEGHLAVYSWPSAGFTVFQNGVEIYNEKGINPFPSLEKASLRQVIEALFGDFDERRRMRSS